MGVDRRWRQRFLLPPVPLIKVTGRILGAEVEKHEWRKIHSRRASCAVPGDLRGRDGALRFYFESGQATELFLFKFCGQP